MPGNGEEFGPCPHCGQLHSEDVLLCPNTEKLLPLDGRILDGKFRFTRQLGEGGMGAVFQADNILVKKTVAIKVMHVQFSRDEGVLARFRNEATAAGRIGSKFICDILDLGKSQLGPYIVMEMLKGHDFAAFVQKNAPVDYGTVVMVMRQALEGLEAAHAAGIVHRDLKPENIFLHQPEPGHLLVKLMDFGISKFTEGNDAGKTGMGVLMGTPEYMSPEQTEGAAQVDHRTDIWAMGVILYWALTGKNPFMGPTMAATLMNVSMREAPPLQQLAPNVPPQLIAIVEKCIRKHPEERWNSCTELRAALEPFEDLHGRFFVPYASRAGVSAPTRTPPPGGTVASTGMPPGMMPPAQPQQSSGMQFQGAASAGPTFSNDLAGVPSQGQPTLAGGFSGANLDDDYGRPQSNMGGGIGGIIAIAVVAVALVGGGGYLIWAQTQQKDRIAEVSAPPEKSDEGGEDKEEPVADKADVAAKTDVAEETKDAKLDAGVAGAEGAAEAGAAEAGAEEAGAEAGAEEGGAAEAGGAEAGAEEGGAEEGGAEEAGAEDDGGADAGGDGGSTPSAKKGSSSGGAKKSGGGSGGAAKKSGGDTSGDSKGGGDKSGTDKAGTSKTLTPAGKRPPREEKDGGGKKQGKKKKKGKKAATE